jgi:hypothetical protein
MAPRSTLVLLREAAPHCPPALAKEIAAKVAASVAQRRGISGQSTGRPPSLTPEQVAEAQALRTLGYTWRAIKERLGLSLSLQAIAAACMRGVRQ